MAFGHPEFQELMNTEEPSEDLKRVCLGAIKHQIGHLLGFVHERETIIESNFDREMVINDFFIMMWEKYQGIKNIPSTLDLLEKAKEQARLHVFEPIV